MSSPIQLTGGGFQDAEGAPLALGYLLMVLSQDSSVNGLNICAGVEVKVPLDANGDADGSVSVWGNDALAPINSYYRVTGYTAQGQPAWGPNNQQVVGSGTFDLGTWVPNQIFSWQPPVSAPLLETDGTPNTVQSILDLEAGSHITLTDNGDGSVTISSSGGTTITLKTNNSNNGSQTVLNLVNGSGISITDDGSGDVTVASTATPSSRWHGWVANGALSPELTGPYGCAPNHFGDASVIAATATEPVYCKVTTQSTINSFGSITDNTGVSVDVAPSCFPITLGILNKAAYRVALGQTAAMRTWIGLSDAAGQGGTLDSGFPASTNLVAFRYSTFDGDTSWHCITQDGLGGHQDFVTAIVADTAGHIFEIKPSQNGANVNFYIDGVFVAGVPLNLPASNKNLRNYVTVDNFDASAVAKVSVSAAYTYWETKV